jgi:plastocyanin
MLRRIVPVVPLSLAVLISACGPSQPSDEPGAAVEPVVDLSNAGSVRGVISYSGDDLDTVIDLSADPTCQELHDQPIETESIVGDGQGHLGNVFVYVKRGLEGQRFPVPSEPNVLEQKGCVYVPHVSGMVVGQKLIVHNDDPTLHNVHAQPSANREFNQGQPFQGMELTRTFDAAELMIPFQCDVHPWMKAYVNVVDNPLFAVSKPDGSFAIDKIPPGDYVVEAVHETLGHRTARLTIRPGQATELNFDFTSTE